MLYVYGVIWAILLASIVYGFYILRKIKASRKHLVIFGIVSAICIIFEIVVMAIHYQ